LIRRDLERLEVRRVVLNTKQLPQRIYGIDFSGALNAGNKIWIAEGTIQDNALVIERCDRAGTFTGASRARDDCLNGLREYVGRQQDAAFGFDFPFGLPQEVIIHNSTWEDFILSFPQNYASPQDFRARCFALANNRELKRHTEREQQTPWSPYNLRLFKQSYYGMGQVLEPLVRRKAVCVLPMQQPVVGKPWLLEVCPASTLKKMGLNRPYKRKNEVGATARAGILRRLEAAGQLGLSAELRSIAVGNHAGDALDSIIAAVTAFQATRKPLSLPGELPNICTLEGYVYA
jgi:hypothetical protein